MKIRALVLSGLGSLGLFSSCVSNQAALKNAEQQHYAVIAKNKDSINESGYSTLKPNGKLSCIEGKDILYFLTPGDSAAYDKAHRLSNVLMQRAIIETQNKEKQLSNNYFQLKAATDGYYKAMMEEKSDN